MKKIGSVLSMTLPLLLGACVATGPLNQQQLQKVRPMAITPPDKAPEGSLYRDTTSAALYATGAQTGIVGALIFGGMAAANESSGVKKFKPATSGAGALVLSTLLSTTREELVSRGYVNKQPGGALGTLKCVNVNYGVAHAGEQRFKATVSIMATIEAPGSRMIWRNAVEEASSTTFTKEEANSNPKLYRDAVQEAARKAGHAIASKI